ncbi:MAG: PAS domain-containing sensor histidine kinase [Ottowia sp.]|nr:PAS domain-containing sensor histidine kinase [Ottowia sp.]
MRQRFSHLLLPGLGVITILVAVGLLLLLTVASANTEFFDRYYSLLYQVNLVVGALLFIIVSSLSIVLLIRLRRGKFGTRLMAKLGVFFAIIGVLPGALIYLVSLQFVSLSIESWFDVKIERALEAGLNLGHATIDNALTDLSSKARLMAEQLDMPTTILTRPGNLALSLSRLQDQFGIQEAMLLDERNHVVALAGTHYNTHPDLPSQSMLRHAQQTRSYSAVEASLDSNGTDKQTRFKLRVIVPLSTIHIANPSNQFGLTAGTTEGAHYLQLLKTVSPQLAENAHVVENAYAEYQLKELGRSGLRKMYIGTLTLTLLLVAFIAMMLALLLGRQLAQPLLFLLQGTKAVAEGDLSPRIDFAGKDELGVLTQQFNQMTRQLADARTAVNINRQALEHSKAYLESILTNLTAGVLVMDHRFILTTANPGAERIFRQPIAHYIGQTLDSISFLHTFNNTIHIAFSEQETSAADDWQKQIELHLANEEESLTLLVRGTRLPGSTSELRGFVVVFDDITEVLSAQRAAAWGEVARRLAHEIKNPLTPIQLSAERMQMKLANKLSGNDAAMLERGTRTIVNQVNAMKHMVDDFRDYARMPPAVLQKLQLNTLIAEMLVLYGIDDIHQSTHDIISVKLAEWLPEIAGDPTQLRQVIHNLIQNALDAIKENITPAQIILTTEVVEYQAVDGVIHQAVKFSVIDNGPGFSPRILNRAFEPYVTTKEQGTGLGLAMVKKISEEHGARIELRNRNDTASSGAYVSIVFAKLAITTDQPITHSV